MPYLQKNLKLIRILFLTGYISSYYFIQTKDKKYINIHLSYNKHFTQHLSIKLVSKPSKSYYVSLKTLKLLSTYLGTSELIISTTKGYLTHHQCIFSKLGGKIITLLP